MSSRTAVYGFLLVLALLGVGVFFFNQSYELDGWTVKAKTDDSEKGKSGKDGKKEDESVPVELAAAIRGSISARVLGTANLRALREVEIRSQAAGVVRKILVEEGEFVRAGQELCRLDDRELAIALELNRQRLAQTEVQLDSAKLLLEKNQAQIKHKKAELARNEQALAEGLVSDTDVTLLRNQLIELELDEKRQAAAVRENEYRVGELQAEIERGEFQLEQTRILAPFAGRITNRTVELGQTVTTNDPLFELAAFNPLYADVYLSELESRRVRPGQRAEIRLEATGEDPVVGKVARVSPVVDEQTGTVKVTAELTTDNPAYRPGAFVRVAVETDTREQTTLIPRQAVIERDGETFVFVAEGDTAKRRDIELGYSDGAQVEALSGLSPGDRVVVAGQGKLKDGDKTREVSS